MKLVVGLGNPGASYLMTRHNIGFILADATAEGEAFVFKKNCKSLVLKKSLTLKERPAGKRKETGRTETAGGAERSETGKLDIAGQGQGDGAAGPRAAKTSGRLQKRSLLRGAEEGRREISFLAAKPQTYMNLSGEAVAALLAFYKIPLSDLLVVQDDVDQEFMRLKFQKNRGAGGHKGIQSIHDCLKTADYARLKLGVGRPGGRQADSATPLSSESLKGQTKTEERAQAQAQSVSDYVLSPFSEEEIPPLKKFLERAAEAVFYFLESGFESAAGEYNGKKLF